MIEGGQKGKDAAHAQFLGVQISFVKGCEKVPS